jgi:hypothetical protein
MSNLTLDSNPSQLLSSIGSEALNKSTDASIASAPMPAAKVSTSQTSADAFEKARTSFFSK